MLDEDTGAEPRVLSASITDPHLLLIRDDGSVLVASMDKNKEIEEVEKPDGPITSTKWSSGCLYKDTTGIFQATKGDDRGAVMMFLLSSTGALHVSYVVRSVMRRHADILDLLFGRPITTTLRR